MAALLAALLAAAAVSPAADAAAPEYWRSRGYGLVAAWADGKASFFDVTRTSCVPQNIYAAARVFDQAHWSAGRRSATTLSPWGLTVWNFDRIESLPEPCLSSAPDAGSPPYNFEVFWRTFDEQYAYFKQRAVDWKAIGERQRARVSSTTTEAELLEVFREMLRQLQDRHTMIVVGQQRINDAIPDPVAQWYAAFDREPVGNRGDVLKTRLVEYLTPSWKRYLDAGSVQHVSANVTSATAWQGRFGYVSIAAESGYARSPDGDDVSAARQELERVFGALGKKRGLILDLRWNEGGSDEVGLLIAGLMTWSDRPGFSKCARNGAAFTPAQHTRIHHSAQAFSGPVVVLTSPLTASAAENLVMMLKDYPTVLIVGDRTAGVHSDPLIKSLPNGWRFTLSNEAFTAPDGFDYEGLGTQPHVLVPFEPERLRQSGVDPAMEKSLSLLASGDFAQTAAALKKRVSRGWPSSCR